jgi:hypothetical protein
MRESMVTKLESQDNDITKKPPRLQPQNDPGTRDNPITGWPSPDLKTIF